MAQIFTSPFAQYTDASGNPGSGDKLYFYTTGTTTLITVYSDIGLTTPQANPVIADSAGQWPAIYLAVGQYKVVLKSAADVTIRTADPAGGVVDGSVTPTGTNVFTGWLKGLTLSNNAVDITNDIDIAVGAARDTTDTVTMVLASALTKRLDAAWTVGTNQGGLDTGVIIDPSTYHTFLIERADTSVVDVLFSLSATAPTMPASYTLKRRIGSIVYSGGKIQLFTQVGDEFLRSVPVRDINLSGTFGTTATLIPLSVPTGIKVGAMVDGSAQKAAVALNSLITSPDQTDSIPAAGLNTMFSGAGVWGYFSGVFRTDTSGQIRVRCDTAAANLIGTTRGWIDNRGRV